MPNTEDRSYQSGKKTYTISEDLKLFANKIADKHNMNFYGAKIEYIFVDPYISKSTIGRCSKARDMYKIWLDVDYIVEIGEQLWNHMNDDQREKLMEHELRHINPICNEKTGEYRFAIRGHDISEFYEMYKNYGLGWHEEISAINQSLNDLDRPQGHV
jgi:predicted metallopeptidase